MRGRRAYVVAAAAWVLVVAVGSTLVWAVISRAGEGVVAGPDAAPAVGVTQAATPRPARTRRPAPAPPSPAPPSPTPPSPTPPSSQPPVSPSQPASPPPATRRGTWQGSAGVVVAECRGSAIRLVGAYPNSGWAVQVEDRGPLRLAVQFEGSDDRGETRLGSRCGQGVPVYAVAGEASSDG